MANNCGPNCECKGTGAGTEQETEERDPYQPVTLTLNAGEVDALRQLINAGGVCWPVEARVIGDRLSAAIADREGAVA